MTDLVVIRPTATDLVVIRPTRLDELRAEIDREHEAAVAAFRASVAHAIRAGELLAEAKALVGHGHWLNWVDANFPASRRTAQDYMYLAKHPEDARRVAHLGIARALRALRAGELPEPDAIEVAQEYALDEDEQAFVQCGAALTVIRDRGLYRVDTPYPEFAAYLVHRWGLDPQATTRDMTLAEERAKRAPLVEADGDRDLAACEAIIRPRITAFNYVGDWLERRRQCPPRREMSGQLRYRLSPKGCDLYAFSGAEATYNRRGRVSYSPLSWGWRSPATDRICTAIGDRLVVGEIMKAVIAGADPVERRLMERDPGALVREVSVRVEAAMRATRTVEPNPTLTAEPDPTLTQEAGPS